MKKQIINFYRGVNNWLNYIFSYKDNMENDSISDHRLIEYQNKVDKLKKEIKGKEEINKEKDRLMLIREERINSLTKNYIEQKRQLKDMREMLLDANALIEKLNQQLETKEKQRRANAGSAGGYKAKLNDLQKKLDQANYTINFYKSHRKSPTLEELKAYEYSRREVEKRIKQK